MCFHIDPKYPEKKIAKRDIPCYKVLQVQKFFEEERYASPYKLFFYKLGKQEFTEIGKVMEYDYINEGFHSYSTKKKAGRIRFCMNSSIFKAIIPKGSEYYYSSKRKEYVSNSIVIKEKLYYFTNEI